MRALSMWKKSDLLLTGFELPNSFSPRRNYFRWCTLSFIYRLPRRFLSWEIDWDGKTSSQLGFANDRQRSIITKEIQRRVQCWKNLKQNLSSETSRWGWATSSKLNVGKSLRYYNRIKVYLHRHIQRASQRIWNGIWRAKAPSQLGTNGAAKSSI